MSADLPRLSTSRPAWLAPALLKAIAEDIEVGRAAGVPAPVVQERALARARALHPAMPAVELREAVALAAWIAGTGS